MSTGNMLQSIQIVNTLMEVNRKELISVLKEKTSFIIAHRLSTIVNADRIFVIDHGSVVEQGAHEELVAQGGLYARMWRDYRTSATWRIEGGDSHVA